MTPQTKWRKANKDKQIVYNLRSKTKSFITKYATKEELQKLQEMISQRMSEL